MIGALLADCLPYVVGLLALLGGVWGYGRKKERAGSQKTEDRIAREIMDGEGDTREAIQKALAAHVGDNPDNARERLRERLRERRG